MLRDLYKLYVRNAFLRDGCYIERQRLFPVHDERLDFLVDRALYVIAPILDPRAPAVASLEYVLEIPDTLEIDDLRLVIDVEFCFPGNPEQLRRHDDLFLTGEIFHHERISFDPVDNIVRV